MSHKVTKKYVLIVEDNKNLSRIYQTILTQQGYGSVIAGDGVEALAVLEKRPKKFSLIFLDLNLPRMDGFGVLQHLRRDSVLARIPVLVLSNYAENSRMQKAYQLGAALYLIKADTSIDQIVSSADQLLAKAK